MPEPISELETIKPVKKHTPKPVKAPVEAVKPVEKVYAHDKEGVAFEFYSQHFSPLVAVNLMGTIKQESGFAHNGTCGDGGLACGLFQWHPDRRYDMPDTYEGQLEFSIKEMKRDSPTVYTLLKQTTDTYTIRLSIHSWIRWGDTGARWIYADQYLNKYL